MDTRFSEYRDEIKEQEALDRDMADIEDQANRLDWQSSYEEPPMEFLLIDAGVCPECNGDLEDNGYCRGCHIIPALNPEFQVWIAAA